MRCAAFLLSVLFALAHSGAAQLVVLNTPSNGSYPAYLLRLPGGITKPSQISGELIFDDVLLPRNESDNGRSVLDVSGRIVMVLQSEAFWNYLRIIQGQNPLAILLRNGRRDIDVGQYEFTVQNIVVPRVPVFGVSEATFSAIAGPVNGTNATIFVNLTSSGDSPWRAATWSWWFWTLSIALGLAAVLTICAAGFKYYAFYKTVGTVISTMPQVVLLLESIGCLIRFLFWGVDPASHLILYPVQLVIPFITSPIPFSLSSTLLMTFYLHETTQKTTLKFSWNVEKFKIPCGILIFILIAYEIVIDGLSISLLRNRLPTAVRSFLVIMYVVFASSVGTFFMVTAIRLSIKIRALQPQALDQKAEVKKKRKFERISSVSLKLGLAGLVQVCSIVVMLILIFGLDSATPAAQCIAYIMLHVFLSIKAVTTVLAVQPPRAGGQGTSKSTMMTASATTPRDTSVSN